MRFLLLLAVFLSSYGFASTNQVKEKTTLNAVVFFDQVLDIRLQNNLKISNEFSSDTFKRYEYVLSEKNKSDKKVTLQFIKKDSKNDSVKVILDSYQYKLNDNCSEGLVSSSVQEHEVNGFKYISSSFFCKRYNNWGYVENDSVISLKVFELDGYFLKEILYYNYPTSLTNQELDNINVSSILIEPLLVCAKGVNEKKSIQQCINNFNKKGSR